MLSRRAVLAVGFAAPSLLRSRSASATNDLVACRDRLARLFPNSLDAARALGRACADGTDAERLLERLCETPAGRERLARAPVDELRRAIETRIRADYTHGRTRRIDGWVLSDTETRLFAIIAA